MTLIEVFAKFAKVPNDALRFMGEALENQRTLYEGDPYYVYFHDGAEVFKAIADWRETDEGGN